MGRDKILQLIDYSSTSSSDDEAVAVESSATPGGGGGGVDVLLQEPRVSSSRTTKSESPRQQVSQSMASNVRLLEPSNGASWKYLIVVCL